MRNSSKVVLLASIMGCALLLTCKQPSQDTTRNDQINKAIEIIKKYDAERGKALEDIKGNGRMTFDPLRGDCFGSTYGARKSSSSDDWIDIDSYKCFSDFSTIDRAVGSPKFIDLLDTLFHEAVHAGQERPPQKGILQDMQTNRVEREAWAADLEFKKALRDGLSKLPADPPPDLVKDFAHLPKNRLNMLVKECNTIIKAKEKRIEALDAEYEALDTFRKLLYGEDDPSKEEEFRIFIRNYFPNFVSFGTLVRCSDDDTFFRYGFINNMLHQYSVEREEEEESETAFLKILSCFISEDLFGRQFIVLSGITSVTAAPFSTTGRIEIRFDNDGDGFFDEVGARVIADCLGFLPAPSSIAQSPLGDLFVFDCLRKSLLKFEDSDGDNAPDRVLPDNQITGDLTILEGIPYVNWTEGRLIGQQRHGLVLGSDFDLVLICDEDGDGLFESLTRTKPSMFPDIRPEFATFPFVGNHEILVSGAVGHPVEILEIESDGAPPMVIGSGMIDDDNNALIALYKPIRARFKYVVSDLTNGLESSLMDAQLPRTVIYGYDSACSSPEGGSIITVSGDYLGNVRRIVIDGKDATIVGRDRKTIRFITPAASEEVSSEPYAHVPVEFYIVGSRGGRTTDERIFGPRICYEIISSLPVKE